MSKLNSSLNNVLDHSISGLCDLPEAAYGSFGNSAARLLSIDLKTGVYHPTGSSRLHQSVAQFVGKAKSILADTSGHDLQFFNSIDLSVEFHAPASPISDVWDGYVASYKVTLSASYPGGKYLHTKDRC